MWQDANLKWDEKCTCYFLLYKKKAISAFLMFNMFSCTLVCVCICPHDLMIQSPRAGQQQFNDLNRVWRDSVPWLWTISLQRGWWWWERGQERVVSIYHSFKEQFCNQSKFEYRKCNPTLSLAPPHNRAIGQTQYLVKGQFNKNSERRKLLLHSFLWLKLSGIF